MRPTISFAQSFFRSVFGTGLLAGLIAMTGAVTQAQTSVALGLYGAFNGTTSGNGTEQSPANQAGGLFEFRQIKNPLVGYEATYSYNRADQGLCPSPLCMPGHRKHPALHDFDTAAISGNAHESNRRLGRVLSGGEPAALRACRRRAFC